MTGRPTNLPPTKFRGEYLVRCTVCGREQRSGPSPLRDGWPRCCGYTMRLEESERFVAEVEEQLDEACPGLREVRR